MAVHETRVKAAAGAELEVVADRGGDVLAALVAIALVAAVVADAALVAIALVAAVVADLVVAERAPLDLDALAERIAIALVAAVSPSSPPARPARPGALAVAMWWRPGRP